MIRVVPRVERGEFVNVGVILFARTARYLASQIQVDEARLQALAPDLDLALLGRHLGAFRAICAGTPAGGPMANLPPSERFHWLTAPRSTIIQTSAVHEGTSEDPATALDALFRTYVSSPAGPGRDPDQTG